MHHIYVMGRNSMDIAAAKKIAAKLISFKMHTCREVYQKLLRKGCDEQTAEETVAEFCKAGILDDAEYAKAYIHDATAIGFKGMYRIKQELLAKGIASSVIDKAAMESDIDVKQQLKNYVEVRFADKVFEDYKDIEKVKAHLMRRGYNISDINKCFKELNITISRGDID